MWLAARAIVVAFAMIVGAILLAAGMLYLGSLALYIIAAIVVENIGGLYGFPVMEIHNI